MTHPNSAPSATKAAEALRNDRSDVQVDWVDVAHELVAYHKRNHAWPPPETVLGEQLAQLRKARNHQQKSLNRNAGKRAQRR